jgi:hypothetical protein
MDPVTLPESTTSCVKDDENTAPVVMSDTLAADTIPTSFGVFKPVGWVMVGFPMQAQADVLVAALHGAGWASAAVLHFKPRESVAELRAMVDNAGSMAGFGYEITLLRRYLALAQEGYCWLLVKVDNVEHAAKAVAVARECGAKLAVHYRMLTVEELI